MRTRWRGYGLVMAVAMLLLPAAAHSDSTGAIAGKELQIGVGPRAIGMGEAQVAVADDLYAMYWNPAGLSRLRQLQVSFMHNIWFGGITSEFIGYAQPFGIDGFGLSLNYTSFGEFDKFGIDSNDYPVPLSGTFTPFTLVTTVGYAHSFTPTLTVGATAKLISEGVDTYNNLSLAFDAGVQALRVMPGLELGLAVRNLGLPLQGFALPLTVVGGGAYHLPWLINEQKDQFLAALDLVMPIPVDQPFYTNLGLEYWYENTLALRAGYRVSQINGLGSGAGLTAGLGFKVSDYTLDYAFSAYGELGITHRISLTAAFGEVKKLRRVRRTVVKAPIAQSPIQDNGGALVPKITGLSLRAPVTVNVSSELAAADLSHSRLQQAVFDFQISSDVEVAAWTLAIVDAQQHVLSRFRGQGNPGQVVWNGTDEQNQQPPESVFATYEFAYTLADGSSNRQTGKLYAEKEAATSGENEAAQVKVNPIYFDESSYDLNAAALASLQQAGQAIKSKPFVRILVDGYTDSGMEKGQEFLLSQRRADAVARYLTVNFKISLAAIIVHARGSKNAVASNLTVEGRGQNRRVEISVVGAR